MATFFPLLIPFLAVAAWIDVRERRIPNKVTFTAFVTGVVLAASGGAHALIVGLFWFAAVGCPLVVLSAESPESFGGGDAKLLAVLALWIREEVFSAIALASILGLLGGLALRARWPEGIPFAPFIAAGALATRIIG